MPTLPGCVALLLVSAVAVLAVVRGIHPFLSPREPVGASTLAVEGWIPEDDLDQVVGIVGEGKYTLVLTTGGPLPRALAETGVSTYAHLAARSLELRGVPVVAVPAPASAQDRTFLSAVMVREWAREERVAMDAIDVLSSGAHGRRSWMLYDLAFGGDARVGIVTVRPSAYDPDAWWRTSLGAKTVLSETIGWAWTKLFFRPSPPGSAAERWGEPSARQR